MIQHRLTTAGGGPIEEYFTEDALHALFDVTNGVPRDICVLGDNLLINGYVRDQRLIDASMVDATVKEMARGKGWKADKTPEPKDPLPHSEGASE